MDIRNIYLKKSWIFILLAVAVKLSYMLFFAYCKQPDLFLSKLQLWSFGGDAHDYVDPVENLVNKGQYFFGDNNYAGRMPGFTFLYLPIRLLFEKSIALNIVLIIQSILSGISVFYLSKIYYLWKKSIPGAIAVFSVYLLSSYVSYYDGALLSESLACSTLIFSVYFLFKYQEHQKSKYIAYSGVFITWAIFSRPFLLPLLAAVSLLLFFLKKSSFKRNFSLIILYILPFTIVDGLWVIRNYNIGGKFIPLQSTIRKGGNLSKHTYSKNKFIKSFGGDVVAWNPGSAGMWFATEKYLSTYGFTRPSDEIFPKEIFTNNLTIDTLIYARKCFQLANDSTLSNNKQEIFEKEATRVLIKFKKTFVQNYPFYHYVKAPFIVLKKLILHSYTYYFPYAFNEVGIFKKFLKLINMLINGYFITIGFIGVFLITFYKKFRLSPADFIIAFLPIFIVTLFSLILRTSEYRYLVPSIPFLLLYAIYLLQLAYKFYKTKSISSIIK